MEKCKNCNKWLGYNEKCSCHNKFTDDTVIDTAIVINSILNDDSPSISSSNDSNSFDGFGGGDFWWRWFFRRFLNNKL
jgi:hypothetical protein